MPALLPAPDLPPYGGRLMCHLCGFKALPPRSCPECRSANILLQGYGTQKVEELLRRTFPAARITRVDADVARRKNAVRTILNQFRAHKIDILLGTQMIAKGLDFPNVTLVGVLNADLGLHIPDPRAGERTFQLLTQVAGRAGRGDLSGEVIIQTFTPQSPSCSTPAITIRTALRRRSWKCAAPSTCRFTHIAADHTLPA
ncbi:MAG: helicase-related protein [Akkermansia sp.]